MAGEQQKIWHKHIYVLLVSTITQWLQIVFTLLTITAGGRLWQRITGEPAPFMWRMAAAAVICAIWTAWHMNQEARWPATSESEAPLARRQALLTKVSAPARRFIALGSILAVAAMMLAMVVFAALIPSLVWLLIGGYYLFLAFWIGIEIIDWKNDRYILTHDRIIDEIKVPLLYEQRTEAPLYMVQNATTSQSGIGVFLDFGNVQVETAGKSRAVLFENVWRPKQIQEAIFAQIDALQETTRRRQRELMAQETLRWFEAYHTLAGGIRDIEYTPVVEAGQPIHVRWRIEAPAGKVYRTWVVWDTESRNQGGEYAHRLRPRGKPDYRDDYEDDVTRDGIHYLRHFIPPPDATAVFFRIVLWIEGEQEVHSSPELSVMVEEPTSA